MHSYAGNNVQGQFIDLANRLEHLITYSSQLIFVSGEAMSNQTRFVQNFFGSQNEHANIVYLDARKNIDLPSFRRRVAQQLTGKSPVDLNKPLTESLSRLLNSENEFVLIAVTHAEGLSNDILKELWDLVLQNRFARHRHHLNVLIFGESNWAEGAKAWLPANSNSKPVLLTSETVNKDQELENLDLDQLMASKREEFGKRVANRHFQDSTNPLKKWWVKLTIVSAFLLSFGGMMIWQYFDLTKEAIGEFSTFLFQTELTEPSATESSKETPPLLLTQEPEEQPQSSEPESNPLFQLPDDQRRVTEWKDAIKALPTEPLTVGVEEGVNVANSDTSEVNQPVTQPENAVADTGVNLSENGINEEASGDTTTATQEGTVVNQDAISDDQIAAKEAQLTELIAQQEDARNDYPVEDIVSIEQLSEQNNAPNPDEPLPIDNDSDATREASTIFDNAVMATLPQNSYVLQVAAMSSEQVLDEYLSDNELLDKVWVYRIERFGGPWHVVVWKQTFPSIQAARDEVSLLPVLLQQAEPFAKGTGQIQRELN